MQTVGCTMQTRGSSEEGCHCVTRSRMSLLIATVQASEVKELTVKIISALQDVGLKIVGLVSDQGSTFSKMFREWGSASPYVNISGNRFLVFPDPPHLLKNMRNMLVHNDVIHAGGTAKWSYIDQFF